MLVERVSSTRDVMLVATMTTMMMMLLWVPEARLEPGYPRDRATGGFGDSS